MGRGLIIEDKLGLLDPVCSQYGSAALSYHWSLGSETLWFSFSHLLPGSVGAGTEGIKESYFLHRLFVFAFFFFFFNWRTAALQYCVGPSTHQHELATGTLHRLAARSLSAPPTPLSPDILDASSF